MNKPAILFLLLASCAPAAEDAGSALTIHDVLDTFNDIDAELNTSWKEEQLPANPIPLAAIEPWTAELLFLNDRIAEQNNTVITNLLAARMSMLKSQLAAHLLAQERAKIRATITADGATNVNCDEKTHVRTLLSLYGEMHDSWIQFRNRLDAALQESHTARAALADAHRPAFYESDINNAQTEVISLQQAFTHCPDTTANPLPGAASS